MTTELTGVIRVHARGFGFVIPDNPSDCSQDIFIPKQRTRGAVDGDRVTVAILSHSRSKKGPEGEVIAIVERSRTQLAGIIETIQGEKQLAHIPILGEAGPAIIKTPQTKKLQVGDRCIFKVETWGNADRPTICSLTEKIGHIDDPSSDTDAAIAEYGLRGPFPKEVVAAAKAFGKTVSKDQLGSRVDLTHLPCFTIDPDTAKDFDDALSILTTKTSYLLGVHIADVAHYAKSNTPLDEEAYKRCNSTYFPGTCLPMLPEELSNHLCSLRPGVNRLTVSVLMEFDKKGNLQASEVVRSCIKSKKRFTYDEALAVLEGRKSSPHKQAIEEMAQLCKLLKTQRTARGSVDFALPELIILVDDKGKPTGTKIEPYHITHQLVEEFMLKANEVVAIHLDQKGKGQLFRIHEEPAEENLEEFFNTARLLGLSVPQKPTQKHLQKLFDQAKKTSFSQQLAISFIRNLKLALYSPGNVGHYGLALEHYCHFTSPIRRYSDLVTQRLLFGEEGEGIDLEEIGRTCSEKERISFKAEMGVKQLKKLRLLRIWMEKKPHQTYPAFVTKIKPFGLYFEVQALNLEGFLHISEIGNDYFIYDQKSSTLFGEKTGRKYAMGVEIAVKPTQVDLIHLESTWQLAEERRKKKTRR